MLSFTLLGTLGALFLAMPLAWKWQLGVRCVALMVLVLGILSGLVVAGLGDAVQANSLVRPGLVCLLTLAASISVLAYRFYRDPERAIPTREDVIVSPADGVVIYLRKSRGGILPVSSKNGRHYTLAELARTPLRDGEAVVIGISMSLSDVHVNRAPIKGRVTLRRHFPGSFGSLRRPEMAIANERATTLIEQDELQIAVIQIASRLVRQIVGFVRQGQQVALGQRIGAIRLGSQVDLVLPSREDLKVLVRQGERVWAGESIVAVIERPAPGVRTAGRGRSERRQYHTGERSNHLVGPMSEQTGALVIGGDNRGLGVARSLGRHGIPVWILQVGGDRLAGASRYARRRLSWPAVGEDQQVDYLLELGTRHRLDGWTLFPTGDETAALLARHYEQLSESFRLTTPTWEVMRWAYDKQLTYRLAAGLGVDHPWTFSPSGRGHLAQVDIPFPLILKPTIKNGVNRFTRDKAWKVEDRQSLISRYDEACGLVGPERILVQELIPGGGEAQFSYVALCVDGQPVASATARRARQYPVDFGHSSSFVETVHQPEIEGPSRRLLAAMGYTGIAEIEFKFDKRDRTYKLLDINARVWTWHMLCSRAGVDFVYLLWLLVHGEPVPEVRARLGVRWVRISTDLPAAAQEVLRRRLSPAAYVRSLRSPLEHATFAFDDPVPALLDLPLLAYSRAIRALRGHGSSGLVQSTANLGR